MPLGYFYHAESLTHSRLQSVCSVQRGRCSYEELSDWSECNLTHPHRAFVKRLGCLARRSSRLWRAKLCNSWVANFQGARLMVPRSASWST